KAYGPKNVLPVFFDRVTRHPQDELERICRFIGLLGDVQWDVNLKPQNVSSERLRKSALRDVLVTSPVLGAIRRHLVPKPWTEPVKALWRIKTKRPELDDDVWRRLSALFDEDLAQLGKWLGTELNCENFSAVTEDRPLNWVSARRRQWT